MIISLTYCGVTPQDITNVPQSDDTLESTGAPETSASDVNEPSTEKHVVAIVMGRARVPEISGKYNTLQNSGKDLAHTPDKVDENGLRDIASVYYPSIGLYDVTDPDYQEYMMQLCKMCYIDTINYYFSSASDVEKG
jgi:hypothetical protein